MGAPVGSDASVANPAKSLCVFSGVVAAPELSVRDLPSGLRPEGISKSNGNLTNQLLRCQSGESTRKGMDLR